MKKLFSAFVIASFLIAPIAYADVTLPAESCGAITDSQEKNQCLLTELIGLYQVVLDLMNQLKAVQASQAVIADQVNQIVNTPIVQAPPAQDPAPAPVVPVVPQQCFSYMGIPESCDIAGALTELPTPSGMTTCTLTTTSQVGSTVCGGLKPKVAATSTNQ